MKKTLMAALAFAAAAWNGNAQLVANFENINYWVGTGPNRAALVIQWNDDINPGSLAWGYRWSGNATGLDMLNAIAGNTTITDPGQNPIGSLSGADSHLAVGVVRYSFGDSIFSIDYSGTNPARTRADWENGYWQYLIFGGSFEYTNWGDPGPSLYDTPGSSLYANVSWFSSPIGMGDRALVDGSWDALSFAPDFLPVEVMQPVSAPRPAADSDHDGLPDSWENQHFGSLAENASADSDGDATTNLMEYLAATNPKSATSVFRPTTHTSGGNLVVSVPTVSGRSYRVWGNANLQGAWTLHDTITGDGSIVEWLYPLTQSSKYFFRIEILIP